MRPFAAQQTHTNGINGAVASSSKTQASGVPPGGPSGSRINTVTYKNSTIKALIDPTLRVSDVIRQLCANAHLGVQEPPALFALRDEEDEDLIDDNNMAKKIEAGRNFKLCSSPTIEAVEMVDKLSSQDEKVLKIATYTLQRLIRDRPFYEEFLKRGGLDELVSITMQLDGGNTLAYTLTCIQNLIESCEEKWTELNTAFIRRVVSILVNQERINVCRPATAILKKLVLSAPSDAQTSTQSLQAKTAMEGEESNAGADAAAKVDEATRSGFEVVYAEMQKEPTFLSTLMQRLGSADTTLCLYSLSLINSLMRHLSATSFESFTAELERLGLSKAVVRLMASSRGDDLVSSILEYQMNTIRIAHHKLNISVTPTDKRHVSALSYIWMQARIGEMNAVLDDNTTQKMKWRRIGFENENVAKDFARTGWLGLETCELFVRSDPEQFAKIILEQINRPNLRKCPWGKAALEVVEILCDHYDIQTGYSTSTRFQPCLLAFARLHSLALRFFLRMWAESGAAISDFGRVSALVRSQVKEALRDENSRSWFEIEADFLESDYRSVRDRQMRELEVEDDFANRSSVRNLRGRLYRESYEFVRQQRIQCLLEGAWFRNASTAMNNTGLTRTKSSATTATSGMERNGPTPQSTGKPWRFYRLSPNQRYLYYCEAVARGSIRSGLDDLPERIDLNLITDISLQSNSTSASVDEAAQRQFQSSLKNGTSNGNTHGGSTNTSLELSSNGLTFSLVRSNEAILATFVALNASQFSEWTDGLSMLRGQGGLVSTKETADYIQILTEIGVKVKLLDLTGESVDVPNSLDPPPVPLSTSFFFAEL